MVLWTPKTLMSQRFSALLNTLNEHQREAVLHQDGPLLVLAGAGSGKTRVITSRIARLIAEGTNPRRILAVTFTNKAAKEMKERLSNLLDELDCAGGQLPFVGTFHALGVYILKTHGERINIPKQFSILDPEDATKIIKELIAEYQLDPDLYDHARIRNMISRFKNELTTIRDLEEKGFESPYEEALARIFTGYEARLFDSHSLDFDDLLLRPVQLLSDHEDLRTFWQEYFQYIHIDEYQDTNLAQYQLSQLLAGENQNIVVVGDIDQAIYSWRGADWRNILNFERDFQNTKIIALEDNYRSTKIILEAAHHVIVNNTERKSVQLRTENPEGDRIQLHVIEDEKQEARFIADEIHRVITHGGAYSDVAILFRTNAQSRAIEEMLVRKSIPYRLVSGVRFYERKEIKDIISYIKLARNPDDHIARKRIINTPPRGIGKVLFTKYVGAQNYSAAEQKKIAAFEDLIARIREMIGKETLSHIFRTIIDAAGFRLHFAKAKDGEERLQNMEELITVAKKYEHLEKAESIDAFLEEAALMSDQDQVDESANAVHLLTAHAAKGLEFDVVIVTGMEEGLFPHSLSQEEGMVEEERRLFYVALTRARKRVILTLTGRRTLYGEMTFNEPSRFLDEIPGHLYEEKTEDSQIDLIDYNA